MSDDPTNKIRLAPTNTARIAMLFIATGMKSIGKTHRTKQEIQSYIRDDPTTGRRGRPVLVVDVNNEYQEYHTVFFDVQDKDIYKQGGAIRDIVQPIPRRIIPYKRDMTPMTPDELKVTASVVANNFRGGLVVMEDLNKIMVNTKKIDFIGMIIGLRHVGVDLMIHFQSISKITPDLWENVNIIRFHKQADPIDRLKTRGFNFELLKIAELIVNRQYESGNIRYFCWVHVMDNRITNISTEDFYYACEQLIAMDDKPIKQMLRQTDINSGKKKYASYQEAAKAWIDQKKYYIRTS